MQIHTLPGSFFCMQKDLRLPQVLVLSYLMYTSPALHLKLRIKMNDTIAHHFFAGHQWPFTVDLIIPLSCESAEHSMRTQ